MTLIVGLSTPDGTYLAADSLGSNGHTYSLVKQPKLFRNGKLGLGYTGSFRLGQLLQHNLSPTPRAEGQELHEYLVSYLTSDVRQCLKDGGHAHVESGVESGGLFLIAAEDRVFTMQSDYSVLERVDGYDAVGSGEDYALAALHATRTLNLPPLQRLRLALEAAEANVTTVRGPWWVLRPGGGVPVHLGTAEQEQP